MQISCPRSPRKRCALPRGRQPTCSKRQTRVARRLSDSPPASTTSASATSKCPPMEREGYISSSATSRKLRTFLPGKYSQARFRRTISYAVFCLKKKIHRASPSYVLVRSHELRCAPSDGV